MELNRFKQLLESTMGNVKPLITEQNTNSYTLNNDKSLENSNTAETFPELKLFKGATFTKVPGAKELVATTKYQFVDTLIAKVMAGPNDIIGFDDAKTYSGKVTYYCGIGKFKVKETKDEYFDEEKNLSNMLIGACNAKDTPVTDPIITPKSDHVCDTDTTSIINKGTSYNYCKNGEKYYFIGTTGNFKVKNPNWTEATGKGLVSIKKMMTNYTGWKNDKK